MVIAAHAIIGGAIGAAVGDPVAAFFAGVASHYIADYIPHTDWGSFQKAGETDFTAGQYLGIAGDIIGGTLVFWYLLHGLPAQLFINILCGAAGGISIDVIDNVPFWNKLLRKFQPFVAIHHLHLRIHNLGWSRFNAVKYTSLGITTQIVIGGLALFFLLMHTGKI